MGVESCKIVFLGRHFLFTCSDTFDVGYIVRPTMHSVTDGRTDRRHHYAISRSHCSDQFKMTIGLPCVTANNELWEKLARSQCWTKYEEGNVTGLDIP